MHQRFAIACLALTCLVFCAFTDAQEPKRRGGTVVGKLEARKDSKDGKNSFIDVLAPGEEKPRVYFVNHDPKLKGPIPTVLSAVRAAKIGDVVEFDWVDTNHGPAIESFRLFKKKDDVKDKK